MEKNIDFVVEHYADMIFRTALSYLNERAEAEDVVSEVLMKYFTNCENLDFTDGEHLKAWLIRVTINKCKDIFKSARFKRNTILEDIHANEFNWSEAEIDIKRAMDKLDHKYRIVLYLYYYEEYKTEEIAEILHTSKGTVVSRLSRARDKLKITLSDYGEEMSV